jgi:predicted PurR-regulated permease PerM
MAGTSRVVVELRARTLFKIVAAAALVWCLWQLSTIILLLIVAVIWSVALDAPVSWLERHNLSRGASTILVAATFATSVAAFFWMTWSSLANQWEYLTSSLAAMANQAAGFVPSWLYPSPASHGNGWLSSVEPMAIRIAQSAVAAATLIVLGFFVTIYLLIEGRQTVQWLVAFFPPRRRGKIEETLSESHDVICAYVTGNLITATFAAIWVLTWLLLLGVPAALLLAVIAAISDFVPVLGFIASALPAAALAATVSPRTALVVLGLYVLYHVIENYFVAPWAYGSRLKLSELAIILAFVAGAELAGVIGALIALPVAALYPTIERIWLREQLPPETVGEHRALSASRR